MVYGSHKTPVFCCQLDLENWAQFYVKRLLSFDKKASYNFNATNKLVRSIKLRGK